MKMVCDGCKEIYKAASVNTSFPESGLVFPFRQLGYYDGFTDNEPWDPQTEDEHMYLCHDCVVKMLDAVPFLYENISKRYGNGLHPTLNEDGTSCCKYCWIPSDQKLFEVPEEEKFFGVFRLGCSGADLESMKPDGEDAVFATEKEAIRWRNKHAELCRIAEVEETNFGWMEKDSLNKKEK